MDSHKISACKECWRKPKKDLNGKCVCQCHKSTHNSEDWEKQLDERFNLWNKSEGEDYNFTTCGEDVKAFIREQIKQAKLEGLNENPNKLTAKEIYQNGFEAGCSHRPDSTNLSHQPLNGWNEI